MKAGLAPILFVLVVSVTAAQPQIEKGPANALKQINDNITLECVTSSNSCDQVEWTKMEGAQSARKVYTNGIILNGYRERYSVNSIAGCSLTITQLQITDSGRFSCVLTVGDKEATRSSVLVVIDVTVSCLSNVPSDGLSPYESYSFWTAISVPAKSVEPSKVTLSFQNKAANETETMNDQHPPTVITTLTGIARKEHITHRGCVASFPPNTGAGFDNSTATLDVCTSPPSIVSYHVENITVSPSSGPYYQGATIRCTAEGYPSPTFQWTHLKSGVVVYGDILVIDGKAGDEFTCTATNTVKGKTTSLNITIEVFSPPLPGCQPHEIAVIVVVHFITMVFVAIVSTAFIRDWCPGCPLFVWLDSIKKKKDKTGFCRTCPCCECRTYFALGMENEISEKSDCKDSGPLEKPEPPRLSGAHPQDV